MWLPKISCKTTTAGRVHVLEEALHSFLIQDYPGEYELIIVNDYPAQKLKFDHPRVKIFNFEETFPTIGDKENFAIEQCSGELIAVWDDDDIAMPWHLSNIARYMEDNNLLHWNRGVFYNEPEITSITGLGNSGIVFRKDAWEDVGKSPIENAGGDTTFTTKLHQLDPKKIVNAAPPDDMVSWFYRWSLPMVYHQSGQGHDKEGQPNIIERHMAFLEIQRQKGNIPVGEIQLRPHWRQDYKSLLKNFIKRQNDTRRKV